MIHDYNQVLSRFSHLSVKWYTVQCTVYIAQTKFDR